jgi:hypothetical protein
MRRLEVGPIIAALLLIAACAGSPRHAPVHRPVIGSSQPHGVLPDAGLPPGGRHLPGECGGSLSVDRGEAYRADVPCTPTLLVPVTMSPSGASRSHTVYRRRPCWC